MLHVYYVYIMYFIHISYTYTYKICACVCGGLFQSTQHVETALFIMTYIYIYI